MSRDLTIYFASNKSMEDLLNQALDTIGFDGERVFDYHREQNYLEFHNKEKYYAIGVRTPAYPRIQANRGISLDGVNYEKMEEYLSIIATMLLTTLRSEILILVDDFSVLHRQENKIKLDESFWNDDFLQGTDFVIEYMD